MAAYAALVSLMNLLEQLQRHPQPPLTLHTNHVETLTRKIAFLQDFLEVYNSHYSKPEMERLRHRIMDVAYAAEDIIETHIVNRIHASSRDLSAEVENLQRPTANTSTDVVNRVHARSSEEDMTASFQDPYLEVDDEEEYMTSSSGDLSLEVDDLQRASADASTIYDAENICSINLHEVIRDMDFVEKEVLEIKDTLGTQHPQRSVATDVVASKITSTEHTNMVGFDNVLIEMLDKLTGQPDSPRQIIPISGMGGIGKTTLARNVYINPLTEYHFVIHAWITISQEYNVRDILLGVLLGEKNQGSGESMREKSEAEIGEMLYKSLCGRRYLIVMDDMWSPAVWDRVNRFFPNQCNGSRIVVTTRLTNVASYLANHGGVEMDFLDQDKSWSLFCKTVFGEEEVCPSELEHVGKEISRNCKGLPLSIVVIGGLLAKSTQTHEYWEYIAKNLNSIVNLEENERCFKILHTSYDQLPAHLKACFLYMGVSPEDHKIHVSKLIGMWVAEGFVKPISGKSLEESAEEYLMDLADRNLIMVQEKELFSYEKAFNIHDLLRELCITEARKEKFLCVAKQHGERLNTQRRIAIHQDTPEKECLDSLKGGLVTRSLICYSRGALSLPLVELRLLRVFTRIDAIFENVIGNKMIDIFGLFNMRYLCLPYYCPYLGFPSFLSHLWNLQTLYIFGMYFVVAPLEIWKLPLIRHIQMDRLILTDPPSGHKDGQDGFVLHELHTLVGVTNLKLGEEVIKRIPNVTRLGLKLNNEYEKTSDLNNLDRLYKLEDLEINFDFEVFPPSSTELMQKLTFPHSLKRLDLNFTRIHWEDISTKIGSLPNLQMLMLNYDSLRGPEWKTVEGQFCSLKYLRMFGCSDLKCWSTESTHFPCLECLHLKWLHNLEEIPLCIGDIPTLKSIIVEDCSDSAVISAKRILDEQEDLGNESFRVRVKLDSGNDKSLEGLATHNFQIEMSR